MNGDSTQNLPSNLIETHPVDALELAPKPHQAARLTALGFSNREICEKLGVSPAWLSVHSSSQLFKATVREMRVEVDEAGKVAQKIIAEAQPRAAEVLVEILDNKDDPAISPRLKKEVAVEMLRGVAIKGESSEVRGIQINVTENKMNVILQTIREIKKGD